MILNHDIGAPSVLLVSNSPMWCPFFQRFTLHGEVDVSTDFSPELNILVSIIFYVSLVYGSVFIICPAVPFSLE
jgi:hypothetical protein